MSRNPIVRPRGLPHHLFAAAGLFLGGVATALDVAGQLLDAQRAHEIAWYLLPAALTLSGFALLIFEIGRLPSSPTPTRTGRHPRTGAVLELIGILLIWLTWTLRGGVGVTPDLVLIVAQAIAIAFLLAARFLKADRSAR